MIPAKQLIHDVVTALREVIAPAVTEPYAKSQAYMAAVILEFVARQVEERGDLDERKHSVMVDLLRDLSRMPEMEGILRGDNLRGDHLDEGGLCALIEHLYRARGRLGEENFAAANGRVRQALRQLLDQDLKVARAAKD
jgi:hypothetical protein